MVSLEIVQIIRAAVPIILGAFAEVRQFLHVSKGLEAKISVALRRFDKEAGIFRARWNALLGLHSRPSELDWDLPSTLCLFTMIEAMDSYNGEKLRDIHEDSQEIATTMIKILSKLRDVFNPNERPTLNHQETRKQRVRTLRKEVLEPITELAITMSGCNEDFRTTLDYKRREDNYPSIARERLSHRVVKKARQDALAIQVVSNMVCNISLHSPLYCECHLALLRLDGESILALSAGSTQMLKPLTKVATKIFFQLLEKSDSSLDPPVHRIYFTDSEYAGTVPGRLCNTPICGELTHSDEDYERFFLDKNGNGKTGLLLRRTSIEEQPIIAPLRISFLQLISRSSELFPGDILRIAASLARSILRFAYSPWASGWTPETIQFFQKECSPAGNGFASHLWIPHLCLNSTPQNPVSGLTTPLTSTSEAIHQLGEMLLLLRPGPPLGIGNLMSLGEHGRLVRRALEDLKRRFGVEYSRIVAGYLHTWGMKDVDLMEEESLRDFLSEIMVLEERAKLFP